MRREEARSAERLAVRLRRKLHRQILSGVRFTTTRRRAVDLRLWRCEPGQILRGMRREAALLSLT